MAEAGHHSSPGSVRRTDYVCQRLSIPLPQRPAHQVQVKPNKSDSFSFCNKTATATAQHQQAQQRRNNRVSDHVSWLAFRIPDILISTHSHPSSPPSPPPSSSSRSQISPPRLINNLGEKNHPCHVCQKTEQKNEENEPVMRLCIITCKETLQSQSHAASWVGEESVVTS